MCVCVLDFPVGLKEDLYLSQGINTYVNVMYLTGIQTQLFDSSIRADIH